MLKVHPEILFVIPSRLEEEAVREVVPNSHDRVIYTGIGPVNTALRLSRTLSKGTRPRALILLGISGVFKEVSGQFPVGSVVAASLEEYGDLGRCAHTFQPIMSFSKEIKLKFKAPSLSSIPEIGPRLEVLLPQAPFVTLMCTSASLHRASFIHARTGAVLENMEGAAFFQFCEEYGIPGVEIRAVSNIAGEPRENWNVDLAMEGLKCLLSEVFNG